jgi:hypothetical protein
VVKKTLILEVDIFVKNSLFCPPTTKRAAAQVAQELLGDGVFVWHMKGFLLP